MEVDCLLWLILGIIIGVAGFWVFHAHKSGKITVKLYQVVLGIIALVMFLLTIENYIGFQKELEPVAANFMLVALGVPAVMVASLIWLIPVFKKGRTNTNETKVSS